MLLRKHPFILSFLTRYFYFFRDILYLFRLKRLPIFAIQVIGFVPEDAEDCETLGGLIMDVLDRIPSEGESLTLEGKEATAKLTVVRMDRHRIDRVKLVLTPKPKQEEEE